MANRHSPAPVLVSQSPANDRLAYPFNGNRYLRVSQAARYLNVSENTVRELCDTGEIASWKSCGKHRRIDARKLYEFSTGLTPEQASSDKTETKVGRLIGLCRVSGSRQARNNGDNKSSLEHQQDRVRVWAEKKYGRDVDEMILSVGSGLNFERKEFMELVERIVTNQLRGATILVTCPDRVCRFGRKLIEFLCGIGGVTLEYISEDDDKTENETLVDDVLAVMTFFTAKNSGRKAGDILRIVMTPEHLKLAYKMKCKGHTYQSIADMMKTKGMVSERGKNYSPAIIRKHLVANHQILELDKMNT